MKWIKIASVILAVFSLAAGLYSFYEINNGKAYSIKNGSGTIELASIDKALIDTGKTIEKAAQNTGKTIEKAVHIIEREIEKSAASDTVGDSERAFLNQEFSSLRAEIEKIEMANSKLAQIQAEVSNKPDSNGFVILMAKLGFSLLFGLSALFVILSQKYEEDTQKWAFSVLSLISGVWIGTIS
jgi:hypothetical protein